MKFSKLSKLSILSAAMLIAVEVSAAPNQIKPPAVIPVQQVIAPAPISANTQAPVALSNIHQAIKLAEQQTKGYAIKIELQNGYGNAVYDVETLRGTTEHHIQIDAHTGKILSSYSEREFDFKPKPKISLSKAIEIANQSIAGQVLEASLDHEYINSHYEVKILSATHPYEIKIDANSGKIIKSKIEYDD